MTLHRSGPAGRDVEMASFDDIINIYGGNNHTPVDIAGYKAVKLAAAPQAHWLWPHRDTLRKLLRKAENATELSKETCCTGGVLMIVVSAYIFTLRVVSSKTSAAATLAEMDHWAWVFVAAGLVAAAASYAFACSHVFLTNEVRQWTIRGPTEWDCEDYRALLPSEKTALPKQVRLLAEQVLRMPQGRVWVDQLVQDGFVLDPILIVQARCPRTGELLTRCPFVWEGQTIITDLN